MLLLLWPVALLYPTPVAFGLGQVRERAQAALADWLQGLAAVGEAQLQPLLPGMQVLCVALGVAAPCLLGYGVMKGAGRRALFAASALLVGTLTLALSTALTWGPNWTWGWLRATQACGLAGGALLALAALPLPQRVCSALLAVALLVQLWLLNHAPANAYDLANLQQWERGRFIHFYGLAQWVGWLWPFVVLVYLLARALARGPKAAVQSPPEPMQKGEE